MKSTDNAKSRDDAPSGATVAFPYDWMTVERFRQSFPRARWSDELKAWFVPGKTAARRFDRWMERQFAGVNAYDDMRGRDAYVFDPLVSKYLLVYDDRLEVSTPFSRTVVDEMRQVPFAAWDGDRRTWTVPYRSYEDLRRRWSRIEAAAERNEPEERRKRRIQRRGSPEEQASRARAAERRRRRYPLQPDHLPVLGRPVMARGYGIVVFIGYGGDPVTPEILRACYADLPENEDYVWGQWRPATHDELIKTWPSRSTSDAQRESEPWWLPNIDELRAARKAARAMERKQMSPRRTGNERVSH